MYENEVLRYDSTSGAEMLASYIMSQVSIYSHILYAYDLGNTEHDFKTKCNEECVELPNHVTQNLLMSQKTLHNLTKL